MSFTQKNLFVHSCDLRITVGQTGSSSQNQIRVWRNTSTLCFHCHQGPRWSFEMSRILLVVRAVKSQCPFIFRLLMRQHNKAELYSCNNLFPTTVLCVHMCVCVYIYLFIYLYICVCVCVCVIFVQVIFLGFPFLLLFFLLLCCTVLLEELVCCLFIFSLKVD
jgi:hypothetical protein